MELRRVTGENWNALIKLKVSDDQTHFVAPNLYSIAEAQFGFDDEGHWDFIRLARMSAMSLLGS